MNDPINESPVAIQNEEGPAPVSQEVEQNANATPGGPGVAVEINEATPNGQPTPTLAEIAVSVLGLIEWQNDEETEGYSECPGKSLHTNPNGKRDCMVRLGGVPTVSCFHTSCQEVVQAANVKLRSALRVGTPARDAAGAQVSPEEKARRELAAWENVVRKRAASKKACLLSRYNWPYEQIMRDSPVTLTPNLFEHWKLLLGHFQPQDIVWIGKIFDSGKPEHTANFRTAEDWQKEPLPPGGYICPVSFKNSCHARTKDNVLTRRFLVVESDSLSRDEVGAVFKWLRDEVRLGLIAIVNTGGKSLHGWFHYPPERELEELRLVLPQLGCDPALFKASQPVRLPGVAREDKYQKLVYLAEAGGERRLLNSPVDRLPLPELYYTAGNHAFYTRDDEGDWISCNESSAKKRIRRDGYMGRIVGNIKEEDDCFLKIQERQNLDYAGNLAGFDAGFYTISGRRVLVTGSPRLIEPVAGAWPMIQEILESMLRLDEVDQIPYFHGWLKRSLEGFYSRKVMPGQVLALAGPPGAGKSLVQTLLTRMFGGREAKPHLYMSGRTDFNADLFEAEHLVVDDEAESVDIASRRHFGAEIKKMAGNNTHQCHGKHAKALILTPLWRMSISLNDDPERMLVLPPIPDDLADKIMLFKVRRAQMPMPTSSSEERDAFMKALAEELPAFVHDLLGYRIPAELSESRFGIKAYQHPELLAALSETAPETHLLHLIEEITTEMNGLVGVEMSAEQIRRRLRESPLEHDVDMLLKYPNSCGIYLSRLANAKDSRVNVRLVNGKHLYTIKPPGDAPPEIVQGGLIKTVGLYKKEQPLLPASDWKKEEPEGVLPRPSLGATTA